ncbi:MAG: hypothetical protein COB51_06315 [Moraxellaceae bacterium]|nr:MAG: hypothetical protein COB51_06315 [Moraxellaceae bacterium]
MIQTVVLAVRASVYASLAESNYLVRVSVAWLQANGHIRPLSIKVIIFEKLASYCKIGRFYLFLKF